VAPPKYSPGDRFYSRAADPNPWRWRTSIKEVCIMRHRRAWIMLIALVLTMINTVPALAATGVIWGS